jgi:hypothetical protein
VSFDTSWQNRVDQQELGRMDPQGDRSLRFPFRRCQAHLCMSRLSRQLEAKLIKQREFIGDFVRHIREHEGSSRPKAFCVGEFWKGT